MAAELLISKEITTMMEAKASFINHPLRSHSDNDGSKATGPHATKIRRQTDRNERPKATGQDHDNNKRDRGGNEYETRYVPPLQTVVNETSKQDRGASVENTRVKASTRKTNPNRRVKASTRNTKKNRQNVGSIVHVRIVSVRVIRMIYAGSILACWTLKSKFDASQAIDAQSRIATVIDAPSRITPVERIDMSRYDPTDGIVDFFHTEPNRYDRHQEKGDKSNADSFDRHWSSHHYCEEKRGNDQLSHPSRRSDSCSRNWDDQHSRQDQVTAAPASTKARILLVNCTIPSPTTVSQVRVTLLVASCSTGGPNRLALHTPGAILVQHTPVAFNAMKPKLKGL